MTESIAAVEPTEGWHVLHLFFKVEYGQWIMATADEQLRAKTNLAALVQEIRAARDTQLITFAVVSPKADLGFVLATPDLHVCNAFEKRLGQARGADVLTPVFSFLSMTEPDAFAISKTERAQQMIYPSFPGWPVVCFYPISLRRSGERNWYTLPFAERKKLVAEHARALAHWEGKVVRIVTGATGLDDAEWGVTLFANNTTDIVQMVAGSRFGKLSAEYLDFGEFYLGLQLPLDQLFRRLQI